MGEYSKGKATTNRALAVYKSGALVNVNTCLPQTAPTAAQTDLKMAAPDTGTGAPQMDQRLVMNTWPKTIHNINMHANNSKN